ncbi:hypothetical protein [Candidatus Uabimicrobium sp. HlEnr_7]|uniref:hypothetical protein n=1 Tax=Candidatus Uabimicrobium helgolandensis TaxID=3095367 RepID=UPI003558CD5C
MINADQDLDPIDILLPQVELDEVILLGDTVIVNDNGADAQEAGEEVDAGDTLTVRSTINHNAASRGASNLETFTNEIATGTSIVGDITLTLTDANGNEQEITVLATDAVSGADISIDLDAVLQDNGIDQLGTGETLTVEYDVLVEDVVQANQTLDTNAAVAADGVDLADTNQVTISPLLEIETTLTPESDPLNVGDSVEISNVINATEGTATNLVITQVLPEGLIPDGFDANGNLVDANEFAINGILDTEGNAPDVTITFNAEDGTLTFTFDEDVVFAAEDGFSVNDEATIVYNATLDNVDAIVDPNETVETTITQDDNNDAPLEDDDSDNIVLSVPVLLVDQVVEDANGDVIADNAGVIDNNQQIDAGDTLTIVNTITHDENNSVGAATLENFTDDLPNNDLVVVNNVTIELLDVNGDVVETVTLAAADAIDANGDIDIDLAAELNRSVLEQGEEVVVTYDVSVQDTVQVADDLLTSAEVTHDSTRNAQDANALTVPSVIEPVTTLTDENDQLITEAELGDTIRVNVDVNATEGTYPDLVITQTLPDGVVPDLDNVVIEGIVEEGQAAPNVTAVFDADNDTVTFTFNGNHVVAGEEGFAASR